MRANRASSKSGMFLTELLIVIAFFAFASTICLQIFAKAHIISADGKNLSRAVTVAQSAAEGFKAVDGAAGELALLLGGESGQEGTVTVYYDRNWAAADSFVPDGFLLRVGTDVSQKLRKADIQVLRAADGEVIYSIQASHFAAGQ